MAVVTGTSVAGLQAIFQGQDLSDSLLRISLGQASPPVFTAQGFAYLCVNGGGVNNKLSVVVAQPVNGMGNFIAIPTAIAYRDVKWYLYILWNDSGLNYEVAY